MAGPAGIGQGGLRAMESTRGIELMQRRRDKAELSELCDRPEKVVQAMGGTKYHCGKSLYDGDLYTEGSKQSGITVICGPRIGISRVRDKPWIFWIDSGVYVSGTSLRGLIEGNEQLSSISVPYRFQRAGSEFGHGKTQWNESVMTGGKRVAAVMTVRSPERWRGSALFFISCDDFRHAFAQQFAGEFVRLIRRNLR